MANRTRYTHNWWHCEAPSLYVPSLRTRALLLGDIPSSCSGSNESQGYAIEIAPLLQDASHRTEINDLTTNALGPIEAAKVEFAPNNKPI